MISFGKDKFVSCVLFLFAQRIGIVFSRVFKSNNNRKEWKNAIKANSIKEIGFS